MAINLQSGFRLDPNDATYRGERNFLLKVAENNSLRLQPTNPLHLRIKLDKGSKGRLVIGYGYDLAANRFAAASELAAVGVFLTPEQVAAILALPDAELSAIPPLLAALALPTETAASALLDLAAGKRESALDSFLGANNLAPSRERAVLMSMWYQLPGGGTPAKPRKSGYFMNADGSPTNMSRSLVAGDRAEVWFEIRYGSSNRGRDGNGVVIRRYAESEVFGLHNDRTSVQLDEAQTLHPFSGLQEGLVKLA